MERNGSEVIGRGWGVGVQTWDPKSWELLLSIWEVLFYSLGSIFLDPGKHFKCK